MAVNYAYDYAEIDTATGMCIGVRTMTYEIDNPALIAIPVYDPEYICKYYNMDASVLYSQSRSRDVVNARNIAMYLIRRMTNLSLVDIGKKFGGRDHSTVLHSLDNVEQKMRSDPAFAEVVKEITTNINSKR